MSYKKAIERIEMKEAIKPYKVCNTIDTDNRMNSGYLVRGIRFEHLLTKLKSQSRDWANGLEH